MSRFSYIDWPFEERIKIIKNFKPHPFPSFEDGNEDAYRFTVWQLYGRVCEAIKAFAILLEKDCICDAFIIAGHALETSAILSYIKDCSTSEQSKENYNKYLASITIERILANLDITNNLNDPISLIVFSNLLKIFYPAGKTILKKNKDYDNVITQINSAKTTIKEKIGILNKSFSPIKPSEYIKTLSDNFDNKDDGQFKRYYTKYCGYKHSNILTPGVSFEDFKKANINDLLYLVLGIMTYLETSKKLP